MAPITGAWNLQDAIWDRWSQSGLDRLFKAEWAAENRERFVTLSDTTAPPGTPWPYAVATVDQGVLRGNSTGVGDTATEKRRSMVPLKIQVFANHTDTEDGKQICRRMAELVLDAFDPSKLLRWNLNVDKLLRIDRVTDFSTQESDEIWSWTVLFEIHLDQTFNRISAT